MLATTYGAYLMPVRISPKRLRAAIAVAYEAEGGRHGKRFTDDDRNRLAESVWKVCDAEEYASIENPELQNKLCDQLWVVYNRLLDDLNDGRNEMRQDDRKRNADALAGRFPISPQIKKERGGYWSIGKRWFGRFTDAEKARALSPAPAPRDTCPPVSSTARCDA